MTDTTIAQSEAVLVAIDIAKSRHEVLLRIPGAKRRRRFTILNQLADFNRLIAKLTDYGRPVRVAFEATGNYHRALAYQLGVAGFEVKLVSSVALARTREALNNSWDKNDPKDAQVILHMMQIGNEQFYHDPLLSGTNDLQELSKTHDIVSRCKTELWHRVLTHYLPLYFPEALPVTAFHLRHGSRCVHYRRMGSCRPQSLKRTFACRYLSDRQVLGWLANRIEF